MLLLKKRLREAELIIAKNRNGGLLNALVGWEASNTKFYEL